MIRHSDFVIRHTARWIVIILTAIVFCSVANAELPSARLTEIRPAGAARGTSVEVTLAGQDLDDVATLYFSSPGVSAKPKLADKGAVVPGVFVVTLAADVKPGLYDVRAIGRYGISNPRTFAVGIEPEVAGKPGNTSAQNAAEPMEGTAIQAVLDANAAQFYKLGLKKGQPIHIEASTRAIESKMEAVMVLSDPNGRELARSAGGEGMDAMAAVDGQHLLQVHDVLYRGGPGYFYRLIWSAQPPPTTSEARLPVDFSVFRSPVPSAAAFLDAGFCSAMTDRAGPRFVYLPISTPLSAGGAALGTAEQPRHLDAPCSVFGKFKGREQRAWYQFSAPAGSIYSIEIVSHRLGEPTAPMLLVQRIEKDDKGQSKIVDVVEASETALPGIPEYPSGSRDPVCRVEIKQAGEYRVLARNMFRSSSEHGASAYCLEIRKESPDFRLVAVPGSPLPDPKDSKDVPISTTFLRRGGVTPVRVVAVRRDGFGGVIKLIAKNLPAGVTSAPATIPPGATTGTLLLSAGNDVADGVAAIAIVGTASIGGTDVAREARPGIVSWSSYDGNNKRMDIVRSRLTAEFMLGVSKADECPISIVPTIERGEVPEGGKLTIPLKIIRRAELVGPISLKLAGHAALAASKEITLDAKADAGSIELDLAQAKLPAGEYALHVESQAKVKYTRKVDGKPQVSDVNGSYYSNSFVVRVVPAAKPVK